MENLGHSRSIQGQITLRTPNGEEKVPFQILYDGEDEDGLKPIAAHVGIKLQDQELWGHGKDYFWSDAFADLQRQLPEGVILKCCMTCRYGNMCPYGNYLNELFCTREFEIPSVEALCDWFDDAQIDARGGKYSHRCADACEAYSPQSPDFETYNDYLYELEKLAPNKAAEWFSQG